MSLTEAPEAEIPVARMLLDHIATRCAAGAAEGEYTRREPGRDIPAVIGLDEVPAAYTPLRAEHPDIIGRVRRAAADIPCRIALTAVYPADMSAEQVQIAASVDLGSLLLDGLIDAIGIEAPALDPAASQRLALGILQATRRRITRTEYIACPGCGRTLYDLQDVLARVRAATSHLPGLKIGVMGCIVNGPGEMADADYGYVGAGPGRVSLYKGKECVVKNIPSDEALPRLIELIKEGGDWRDADS